MIEETHFPMFHIENIPSRPVFFMHIAKTAGSYLNSLFKSSLGSPSVETHIEGKIGGSKALKEALDRGVSVFSGHVMYGLWKEIERPSACRFTKITIVRDPIEHLASHIQWLDHYNLPEMRSAYQALDESHQRIVDRIGAIDLSNISQIDRYLTNLGADEIRLFDNCQTRYFVTSGRKTMDAVRPLSLADCQSLRRAMSDFDVIARQSNLESDIVRIASCTGLHLKFSDVRVNSAKSERRIETRNPVMRQVLGKRTLVDQWLWRELENEGS